MDFKILYEDRNVLVVDKPAGIAVFQEIVNPNTLITDGRRLLKSDVKNKTLIDLLLQQYPELKNVGKSPRYGIVHRLDKDTSGILLVAKNNESLIFLQKQFKNRAVEKKYTALVVGLIKDDSGTIETLIGRAPKDKRKQKAYLPQDSNEQNLPAQAGKRLAITNYEVVGRYESPPLPRLRRVNKVYYTLLKVQIKTGRKHQIRCHLSYIHHPIAGDKMYGFKDSPTPKGLTRQFLHASYLKITSLDGTIKEFNSELPTELTNILSNLQII